MEAIATNGIVFNKPYYWFATKPHFYIHRAGMKKWEALLEMLLRIFGFDYRNHLVDEYDRWYWANTFGTKVSELNDTALQVLLNYTSNKTVEILAEIETRRVNKIVNSG